MGNRTVVPPSEYDRLTAHVYGRVQGIGFRWTAIHEAELLSITGWIHNEDDGSVSCLCEGRRTNLTRFLGWLHKGPPGAWVQRVDCQWGGYTGGFAAFNAAL